MVLCVQRAGSYSLIVDAGRCGWSDRGVPRGGAADRGAFQLAHALVGNPTDCSALEITLAGPTLLATADHHAVVVGAPFEVKVRDRLIQFGSTFQLRSGDVLQIGGCDQGVRAYLAIHGGFHTPRCLGSQSAFKPIQRGDILPCEPSDRGARFAAMAPFVPTDPVELEVLPGSTSATFPVGEGALRDWLSTTEFVVSTASDRMGIRLHGPKFVPSGPAFPAGNLVSAPVVPGTVQLPAEGLPIVLGVDAQTIGGYPRIAHVVRADLDRLGQLRPGKTVRFRWTTLEQAETRFRDRETELRALALRLQAGW